MKRAIFFLTAFVFSIGIINAKDATKSDQTNDLELIMLTCHDVAIDYAFKVLEETGSYGEAGIAYAYAKDLCDYYN